MLSCVRFLWPVLRCTSLAGFGVYLEVKKHWTNREISDMAVRPLTFTEYDAMLIKESLVSVTK